MKESKKDEGLARKMKYVKPELISLDKGESAEGKTGKDCTSGSGATASCSTGAGPTDS
jgi:hypothetical protein